MWGSGRVRSWWVLTQRKVWVEKHLISCHPGNLREHLFLEVIFRVPVPRQVGIWRLLDLANKTSAVRYWLLREERERSIQKPWTFCSSSHLPSQGQVFKVTEDSKVKKFSPVTIMSHCEGHIEARLQCTEKSGVPSKWRQTAPI